MSFFNSKEEVLDIQLTQYGKLLYSKAKFKPMYYAFFDDDIIYDSQYTNNTESQNSIESRIQEETPYIKTISSLVGCETNLQSLNEEIYNKNNIFNFTKILGTSDLDYNYAASWSINLLKGTIKDFKNYFTGSNNLNVNVPQIDTSVVYETSVVDDFVTLRGRITNSNVLTVEEYNLLLNSPNGFFNAVEASKELIINEKRDQKNYNNFDLSEIFTDGSAVLVEQKTLLVDIGELYTQLDNDMFEIEVFRYDKDSEGQDFLTKLFFKHKAPSIVNNILMDETSENYFLLDNSYVEYYFDVFADNEIDNETVCNFISPTQNSRNTMVSVVACDETINQKTTNSLYATAAKPNGDNC